MFGQNKLALAAAAVIGAALLAPAASAAAKSAAGHQGGAAIHRVRPGAIRSICPPSGGPSCSGACPLSGPPCRAPDAA